MQIKRHWFLVETMPFEYFFSGVYTPASGSKQAARASPGAHSACFVPRLQNPYRKLNCPTKGAYITNGISAKGLLLWPWNEIVGEEGCRNEKKALNFFSAFAPELGLEPRTL